ncbi:4364_t:CDS:2 [Racocetra persica]|uniref:4364_t:CDS:1 n=1 Tax=Racocetra persica TaxID=160502 RepID=A0ACA9L999_9GLOM|nr:4364_t:CDS:2 [Racocetra persica]
MPIDSKLRHDMLTSLIIAYTERDVKNIKSVKGNILRPLTDHEIRRPLKLEYCDAVINEVNRIRPTGNEFPRYFENPCEVADYLWNAGTMFHVNMDPNARHKFSLVIFGGGLRNCPGRKLATIELLSLLVLVFRKYDIELVDMSAPLMTKSTIANSCEESKVRIRPRN